MSDAFDIASLAEQYEPEIDLFESNPDLALNYTRPRLSSLYALVSDQWHNYDVLSQEACDLFDEIPMELLCVMACMDIRVYRSLLAIPKFARYVSQPWMQEVIRARYTQVYFLSDINVTQYQCGKWIHRPSTAGPARLCRRSIAYGPYAVSYIRFLVATVLERCGSKKSTMRTMYDIAMVANLPF